MGGDIHLESQVGQGTNISFHIWVDEAEKEEGVDTIKESNEDEFQVRERKLIDKLAVIIKDRDSEKIGNVGWKEKRKEVEKLMSKLILSVLMENWEKAEMFADMLKQLLEDTTEEVKKLVFRLKMAVQKEDSQKVEMYHEQLQRAMEDFDGNEE